MPTKSNKWRVFSNPYGWTAIKIEQYRFCGRTIHETVDFNDQYMLNTEVYQHGTMTTAEYGAFVAHHKQSEVAFSTLPVARQLQLLNEL